MVSKRQENEESDASVEKTLGDTRVDSQLSASPNLPFAESDGTRTFYSNLLSGSTYCTSIFMIRLRAMKLNLNDTSMIVGIVGVVKNFDCRNASAMVVPQVTNDVRGEHVTELVFIAIPTLEAMTFGLGQ